MCFMTEAIHEASVSKRGAFCTVRSLCRIALHTFYPPNTHCSNSRCTNLSSLKAAEQRAAVVFTLDKGTLPAYSIYLTCPSVSFSHFCLPLAHSYKHCAACRVQYHHNYSVQEGRRYYYPGIPDVLQVGTGKFVSKELVELWISQMLSAWCVVQSSVYARFFMHDYRVSAANCAHIYNTTLAEKTHRLADTLNPFLKGDHVWLAFIILSLLEDCQYRDTILDVTHFGEQQDRFREAVASRNLRVQQNGLPDIQHYCLKCTRFYNDEDGNRACAYGLH